MCDALGFEAKAVAPVESIFNNQSCSVADPNGKGDADKFGVEKY